MGSQRVRHDCTTEQEQPSFGTVCFHFCLKELKIVLLISSVTHCLFRRVLFNFHTFVNFLYCLFSVSLVSVVFTLLLLIPIVVSNHCGKKMGCDA